MTEDSSRNSPPIQQAGADELVVPIVEEKLEIGKRLVETGTLRLRIDVEEHTETVQVPLKRTRWDVEHVPVNRVVAEAPAPRVEGNTTIYPVMEERIVVTRELVVVEELRVTRLEETAVNTSDHIVRRETVREERIPKER